MAHWDFTRERWAGLAPAAVAGMPGGAASLDGDPGCPVPHDELVEVYLPLCGLIAGVAAAGRARRRQVRELLGGDTGEPPFVVGVAGGVAVGKSTVATTLGALLGRWPELAPVEVLSTDAFLHPNRELAARGLTARKGFPESYDWHGLLAILAEVRTGADGVAVPVYSHRDYDVMPGDRRPLGRPSTLVVEGLNVLQTGPTVETLPAVQTAGASPSSAGSVGDYLDWSIYLDAAEPAMARWHVDRLLELRRPGVDRPTAFLEWYGSLSDEEALAVARESWSRINAVNLREHILPTRDRASMIVHKRPDHRVDRVSVRVR